MSNIHSYTIIPYFNNTIIILYDSYIYNIISNDYLHLEILDNRTITRDNMFMCLDFLVQYKYEHLSVLITKIFTFSKYSIFTNLYTTIEILKFLDEHSDY